MEPMRESAEAAGELDPVGADDVLLEELLSRSERARALVPDLMGVSVAQLQRDLTFTLVATATEIAALDAVQYLTAGPCVEVGAHEALEATEDVLMSEDRWQVFARATAAHAIRSTLTLPIVEDDAITGSVNLYGGSARAFEGHHEELAGVFGAWAPGAVTNADLSFSTRADAARAPQRVRDQNKLETAVGIVAATLRVDLVTARERLREAAARAGVGELTLAQTLILGGTDDL